MALKVANVLLTIEIDGKDQLALAKDIQASSGQAGHRAR